MEKENDFELKDLASGDNKICMAARVNDKGDAEAIVHATEEDKGAVYKLIVLFALLLKSLEQKIGYSADVICNVARNYLDSKHKGHDDGCKKEIDTGW